MNNWKNLLQSTKAIDILGDQKLVTIDGNQTVKDCLSLLKQFDITGLPVLDKGRPIGLIDVLDIAAYALFLWRNCAHSGKITELLEKNKFFDKKVLKLANFSGNNRWIAANENSTLFECLQKFCENFNCHRLPIINNNGDVVKILSMADILKFASKNLNNIEISKLTLREIPHLFRPCVMIRHDNLFIEALASLIDNRVSGLAVVDWENKLEANLSASDLRGLLPAAFELFDKPIIDFLRQATETKSKIPPIALNNTCTFGETLNEMTSQKIHRIFLNDRTGRFYGIVSCTDLVHSLTPKASTAMATSE